MKRTQPIFYWFRSDLRIQDNPGLLAAVEQGAVQPVYIIDPRNFHQGRFGFNRMGYHRRRFLMESLKDLVSQLESIGLNLWVLNGISEEILPRLLRAVPHSKVHFSYEFAYDEAAIEQKLSYELSSRQWEGFWSGTLVDPEDLPFTIDRLPNGFSSFRNKVEKYVIYPAPVKTPENAQSFGQEHWGSDSYLQELRNTAMSTADAIDTIETLGIADGLMIAHTTPDDSEFQKLYEQWVGVMKGGALAGWQRLNDYLWDSDRVARYKETRNGLIGLEYSTKFSVWLANGSLSARSIAAEITKYEQQRTKNDSTYWVIFELLWRDFFRLSALKYGAQWFAKGGIQSKTMIYENHPKYIDAWVQSKTGFSFIDANMKELATIGFMSNRGRQNVASFFTQNLNLDWRIGAEYFEHQLIDYDPASNYGNWMYNATLGHDPRNRFFNIEFQADRYDSSGEYVRLWCRELKKVPLALRHKPYQYNQSMFAAPIIDLEKSYEKIRKRA